MAILSILLMTLFMSLAILHFHWAAGGKWALEGTLPQKESGELLFSPGPNACVIVGLGLLVFGLYYGYRAGFLQVQLSIPFMHILKWAIPGLFILRAIGDFRYVGFFKRIKYTQFGRMDSSIFSPISLAIGIAGILINILSI